MFPSWMRSPKGRPIPRYFFAIGMTSLKFFSMSLDRAVLSPSLSSYRDLSFLVRGVFHDRSARSTSQEGLGSPDHSFCLPPLVLSRILLAMRSLASSCCVILQGICFSRSLRNAPFWLSSIRPLKGPISYPSHPVCRPNRF